MAIDFSSIGNFLTEISSVAVIAGAVFVVFQLRQNGRLIAATLHESSLNASFSLLEKITDDSYAIRRKRMHDVAKKYAHSNDWKDFDDSIEDFEVRNFAYQYELFGQLAQEGIVDLGILRNALQYLVVYDWEAFAPIAKHLMERYKVKVNPWSNFEWLAKETEKFMKEREQATGENHQP